MCAKKWSLHFTNFVIQLAANSPHGTSRPSIKDWVEMSDTIHRSRDTNVYMFVLIVHFRRYG